MTNESKPRAATETADALNAAIIKKARTLTDANRKYELATSVPSEVTSLGWQIIAIDLRTYGSSDLTIWRAQACERNADTLRQAVRS